MIGKQEATTDVEKTLVTVGAHPDDASIFWGGSIAKSVDEGWRVISVILDQGARSPVSYDISTSELIQRRAEELQRESQRLRVELVHLQLSDLRHEDNQAKVRQHLTRLFDEVRPIRIITHHINDKHMSHAICAQLTIRSLLELTDMNTGWQPEVWMADGWEPVRQPNVYVDITPYFNIKLAAIAQHSSQLFDSSYLLGAMGLSMYRASFAESHKVSDPRRIFVEAFRSLSLHELHELDKETGAPGADTV